MFDERPRMRAVPRHSISGPFSREIVGVGFFFALLLAIVFGQIADHRFVNFDDPMYLYENGWVTGGLNGESWAWAWTNKDVLLWHPLTWLLHLTMSELFGMNPAPHLLLNLGLHGINVVLLFVWCRIFGPSRGVALVVATLFAIHPVNVETVAWASQLKSTLSTTCLLGTMLTYCAWGRTPKIHLYAWAVVFSILGLLAKPMLVTLPFLLLVLDYWPLNRLSGGGVNWRRIGLEKAPFVLLAAAGAVLTLMPWGPQASIHESVTISEEGLPLDRLASVPLNIWRYLSLLLWPIDLAVLYPEQLGGNLGLVFAAIVGLGVCSWTTWRRRTVQPVSWFGWLWFLVGLVPVSGIVGIGPHGWADRYLYVPQIGLLLALVCWLDWLLQPIGRWRAVVAGVLTINLAALSFAQTRVWRNSLTLWENAAAITPTNGPLHNNLGNALLVAGNLAAAAEQFELAQRLEPTNPRPYINLAVIAQRVGAADQAVELLRQVLEVAPNDHRAMSNLAALLMDQNEYAAAQALLEQAIVLRPEFGDAHTNLGVLHAELGNYQKARAHFLSALRINPSDKIVEHNLSLLESAP